MASFCTVDSRSNGQQGDCFCHSPLVHVHVGIDNDDNGVQNSRQRWLIPPPETGHIAGDGGEAGKRNGAAAMRPKSSKLLQNWDDDGDGGDDDDGDYGESDVQNIFPFRKKKLKNILNRRNRVAEAKLIEKL